MEVCTSGAWASSGVRASLSPHFPGQIAVTWPAILLKTSGNVAKLCLTRKENGVLYYNRDHWLSPGPSGWLCYDHDSVYLFLETFLKLFLDQN